MLSVAREGDIYGSLVTSDEPNAFKSYRCVRGVQRHVSLIAMTSNQHLVRWSTDYHCNL